MILGDICTRKCGFCNIKSGKPRTVDLNEPYRLAQVISKLKLKHVVITSVDRDDLKDGGAEHFSKVMSLANMSYFQPAFSNLICRSTWRRDQSARSALPRGTVSD